MKKKPDGSDYQLYHQRNRITSDVKTFAEAWAPVMKSLTTPSVFFQWPPLPYHSGLEMLNPLYSEINRLFFEDGKLDAYANGYVSGVKSAKSAAQRLRFNTVNIQTALFNATKKLRMQGAREISFFTSRSNIKYFFQCPFKMMHHRKRSNA